MTRDEAITRARKLLAFSTDRGASLQEVETAGRLLERLMRQWSIEEGEIAAGMGAPKGMVLCPVGPDRQRWPKWEAYLLSGLAELYGVRVLIHEESKRRVIVGKQMDVDMVAYAFDVVRNQTRQRSASLMPSVQGSFAFGVVIGFLRGIQHEREEQGDTQAVAVVNEHKLSEADQWMVSSQGAEIGRTIKRDFDVPADVNAFRAGLVAGQSITINPGLPGGE